MKPLARIRGERLGGRRLGGRGGDGLLCLFFGDNFKMPNGRRVYHDERRHLKEPRVAAGEGAAAGEGEGAATEATLGTGIAHHSSRKIRQLKICRRRSQPNEWMLGPSNSVCCLPAMPDIRGSLDGERHMNHRLNGGRRRAHDGDEIA